MVYDMDETKSGTNLIDLQRVFELFGVVPKVEQMHSDGGLEERLKLLHPLHAAQTLLLSLLQRTMVAPN